MKRSLSPLLGLAIFLAPSAARAANFNVTSVADSGTGSLREAVAAANAAATDDNIFIGVPGPISLTTGELVLANNGKLTISGTTDGVTVSGGGLSRVFRVDTGASVTLSALTISNGLINNGSGGAIINDGGNLTVNNSTLTGNSARGNGTASSLGGAIYNPGGNLTLTNCTFAGNSVSGGANNEGGGVYSTGPVAMLNCTLTGNSVSGTASQGGGIRSLGTLTLANSLVVGNTPDNLSGATSMGSTNNITTGTPAAAGLDPAGLQDNGGAVRSIALTTRGTAVNKGSNAVLGNLNSDTRGPGFPRTVGLTVDIGAFESIFSNRPPLLNNETFSTSLGFPFNEQLMAVDEDGDPLTYVRSSGALPLGLSIDINTGVISGTPFVPGRSDFSVNVNDGKNTTVGRFIIIVSANSDGVGPVITRDGLAPSYTRDELANIVYRGTVTDVAAGGATPSGVEKVLFQLRRDSDNSAYSGSETTGFTSNLNIGYFSAFLDVPVPNTTAGTRNFRRTFGANGFIPSAAVLKPDDYSLVIAAKDVAGNYSVEVVPFKVVLTPIGPIVPPIRVKPATSKAPSASAVREVSGDAS